MKKLIGKVIKKSFLCHFFRAPLEEQDKLLLNMCENESKSLHSFSITFFVSKSETTILKIFFKKILYTKNNNFNIIYNFDIQSFSKSYFKINVFVSKFLQM